MGEREELEMHLARVQLDYRRLWLEDAHELGQIAETLAHALGWQPTEVEPLPNPLELAEVAAQRIISLERQAALHAEHTCSASSTNMPKLRARAPYSVLSPPSAASVRSLSTLEAGHLTYSVH